MMNGFYEYVIIIRIRLGIAAPLRIFSEHLLTLKLVLL